MNFITAFGRFWYDFIVGDDWTIALAVVAAIVVTWLLVHANVPAWWFLPVIVILVLGASVWRVARPRG